MVPWALAFGALLLAARAEDEECPLLQVAGRTQLNNTDPSSARDGLDLLTKDEWATAATAMLLSSSAYQDIHHTRKWGQVLKEVQGKHPETGADFMMARLVRTKDGKCWVAFRGTANAAGWKANAEALLKFDRAYKGVWIPTSWWAAYLTLEGGLKEAIHKAYAAGKCQPERMYLTGHSLGAILANYAAFFDLAGKDGHHAQCLYTAGASRPWTVNEKVCRKIADEYLPRCHFRFVRFEATSEKHDLIGNLPPYFEAGPDAFRFRHCASQNIALFANSEALTPSQCTMRGMDREQCRFMKLAHGVQKMTSGNGPQNSKLNDVDLHDSVDYVRIVVANSMLDHR